MAVSAPTESKGYDWMTSTAPPTLLPTSQPALAMDREILVVGSSRVHGLLWRRRPGFSIRLHSYSGLTHKDLIYRVNEVISENTAVLILVALQVELHSRTIDRQGRPGLVYANPTPPIRDICATLSSSDLTWKSRGIHVLWIAPYTPNMILLNTTRKQKRKWGAMMPYEIEMAEHFQEVINGNRLKLIDSMKKYNLDVFELELRPWDLTKAAGSDGLHLGTNSKRALFDAAISRAIEKFNAGPPTIENVGLSLDAEERETWNQIKRQKRRMRRVRAAERDL